MFLPKYPLISQKIALAYRQAVVALLCLELAFSHPSFALRQLNAGTEETPAHRELSGALSASGMEESALELERREISRFSEVMPPAQYTVVFDIDGTVIAHRNPTGFPGGTSLKEMLESQVPTSRAFHEVVTELQRLKQGIGFVTNTASMAVAAASLYGLGVDLHEINFLAVAEGSVSLSEEDWDYLAQFMELPPSKSVRSEQELAQFLEETYGLKIVRYVPDSENFPKDKLPAMIAAYEQQSLRPILDRPILAIGDNAPDVFLSRHESYPQPGYRPREGGFGVMVATAPPYSLARAIVAAAALTGDSPAATEILTGYDENRMGFTHRPLSKLPGEVKSETQLPVTSILTTNELTEKPALKEEIAALGPISGKPFRSSRSSAGLEELQVQELHPWTGPREVLLGQVRNVTDKAGTVVGRMVVPNSSHVQLALEYNDAIHHPNFPQWQQPDSPQPYNPQQRERLNQAGFRFEEWWQQLQTSAQPSDSKLVYLSNSLQSNFHHPWGFLIVDGKPIRQAYAWTDYPMRQEPQWVFVLDQNNPRVTAVRLDGDAIQELLEPRIENGQPVSAETAPALIRQAISGLPILINSQDVSGQIQWNVDEAGNRRGLKPNEVTWDPERTKAAFSAVGTTENGQIGFFAVTANLTIQQFTKLLIRAGFQNAIVLGGSADVKQRTLGEEPEDLKADAHAASTQPGADRPLNAVIAGYTVFTSGLEEAIYDGTANAPQEFIDAGLVRSGEKRLVVGVHLRDPGRWRIFHDPDLTMPSLNGTGPGIEFIQLENPEYDTSPLDRERAQDHDLVVLAATRSTDGGGLPYPWRTVLTSAPIAMIDAASQLTALQLEAIQKAAARSKGRWIRFSTGDLLGAAIGDWYYLSIRLDTQA